MRRAIASGGRRRQRVSAATAPRPGEVEVKSALTRCGKDAGRRPGRADDVILALLSFGAGAADAFAFTALGGIFTANMTGNVIIAGLALQPGHDATLMRAGIAFAGFASALLIGFRLTRTVSRTIALRTGLAISALCMAALALLWHCAQPSSWATLPMIALSAMAMAFQTVAAKRAGARGGATTTFVTGTLTDLLRDLVDKTESWRNARWVPLAALPAGAAAAMLTWMASPAMAPLPPLAANLSAMALLARRRRSARTRRGAPGKPSAAAATSATCERESYRSERRPGEGAMPQRR